MTRVPESLAIRLLGPLEVRRDGELVELPPSKKTRALLSYLVLTRREHRRERLCALFWDVTDDPRGALRWSLSKLRQLVDDDTASVWSPTATPWPSMPRTRRSTCSSSAGCSAGRATSSR